MRINYRPLLLVFSAAIFFLASCQKEIGLDDPINNPGGGGGGTGTTKSIIGDWDFLGMTASTNTSVTVTSPLGEIKAVTVSNYVTKSNAGTVKITATEMISNGVTYVIDTTMNVKTYMAGMLIDEQNLPFDVTAPATSATSSYTKISADSLTTTAAIGVTDPAGGTPAGPVGVKIMWAGDTLLLKVATSFTQTITQAGMPATLTASVTGITKLKKR